MTLAGQLRHRVTLQSKVTTRDANGAPIVAWQDVATVWAMVLPASGREFVAAQAAQSEVTGKIVIRYRADVDATMRVVHDSKNFNIVAVLPDADSGREHLTLMVTEGVNDG